MLWRLVYLFEDRGESESLERARARRVGLCFASTGDSALTHGLLSVIADQDRFCAVIDKYTRGVISRTGFLSVIGESGYPAHVKSWLRRAGLGPLGWLCERLAWGEYGQAAEALERPPD